MLLQPFFVAAQDISFFHVSTSNGLSDNLVTSVVRDKNGLLWIGTAEGLNSYDGYAVKRYYKEEYPALGSNHIAGMICDDRNRIWLRNAAGFITVINEKRTFMTAQVIDSGKSVPVSFIRQTKSRGILLFNRNKLYVQNKNGSLSFERLSWNEDTALQHRFGQIVNDGDDILLMTGIDRLCVFDARNLKVLHSIIMKDIIGAARLNKDELIITTEQNRQLLRYSLSQKKIIKNYGEIKDQYGDPVKGYLRHIRRMNDGRFIISSGYGGVYVLDTQKEELFRYHHDPLNGSSISANNTFYVHTDSSGYVYITTRSAGINYFNTNYNLASYRSSFQETTTGKIFQGFINNITRHKAGNFWLGTQSGLIEWDKERNHVQFHEYGNINGIALNGVEEVRALCFDTKDNLWVGLNRFGIVVLDRHRKVVKYINADSLASKNYLPGNWINSIILSPRNKLWIATSQGLCIVDPETFQVEKMERYGALKQLSRRYCYNIWFRNSNEVWIGTNTGAYRYRESTDELFRIDTENGLPNNYATCFTDDVNGNVYVGTSNGLAIVQGNKVAKIIGRNNGLRSERCNGLLRDNLNNIWIGNDNALVCYNAKDNSVSVYDDSYGLSPFGFRLLSYYQSANGEQFWGSDRGISYFFPKQLRDLKTPLQVRIGSLTAGNKTYGFTTSEKVQIPFSQNNLQFSFSAIDLFGSKSIVYEYKLAGADTEWKKTTSPQLVNYSNLSPGSYTFLVRASKDGVNWTEADNPVSVLIETPWWKTFWFVLIYLAAIVSLVYYFIQHHHKKIKKHKEELETEQAINYFATSITRQSTVEETLWDVARNCIGRLGFEDCVIYLKEEKRNVLVQKAAWGPKTTRENKIVNPIEIQVGKGIVGHVAKTGKAETVSDTSADPRYIVDDIKRFSEITVPIIADGIVLGIIDSEHSKKHFFTPKHLSILTTIASLCANKIVRSQAEEEKQKVEKNLQDTQRQTAEMEMQALRAQMNPHFLFNSLNSINNFILKNDPDNASQYLTRFSRLMRLILDNSREEWISLESEIKALRLYIEMEAIRFDNVFDYKISIAPDVNPSFVPVPPMVIQPYVENAIWHGLLHRKAPGSRLEIEIWKADGELFIKVDDNGVGRAEADVLKSKLSSLKKSHGMKITAKRLDIVNSIYKLDAAVAVDDLKNMDGKTAGTSVLLRFRVMSNHFTLK